MNQSRGFAALTFAASLLCSTSAFAQLASSGKDAAGASAVGDDDAIVVTAQRREESILRTPVAISAISGDALEARGIRTVSDLEISVPALAVNTGFGMNQTQIRGVGLVSTALGVDSASAFYINGNVISRPSAQVLGFYDLERVEILRGPQGTLYGRNATSGLVNLITRRPTKERSGYLNASYGNYNAVNLQGALSGALDSDGKILARVAFLSENRDGYGTNLTTGEDFDDASHLAVRGTLEMHPSENVTVTIVADHSDMDDHIGNRALGQLAPQLTGVLQGGRTAGFSRDVYNDTVSRYQRKNTGISGEIEVGLGDVTLKSLTSYRDFDRDDQNDIDGTDAFNADLKFPEKAKQFSQELQANFSTDRFKGVAGLFYFYEDQEGTTLTHLNIDFYSTAIPLCGFNPACQFSQGGRTKTNSYAAFAQGTYDLTEQFSVTAGLRYTSETKELIDGVAQSFLFVQTSSGKKTWDSLTPRFGVEYRPSDSTLIFATVAKGFRAGTFLLGVPQPPVNPETLWSYELGLKTRFLDNRGRLSLTGYYTDYKDLQVGRLTGTTAILENAAKAEIYGFELEGGIKLTDNLSIDATFTHTHGEISEFSSIDETNPAAGLQDLSGNQLPNAPRWASTIGLQYNLPLQNGASVAFRADANWRSKTYYDYYNRAALSQDAYAKANASITYSTADGLSFGAFVNNITDETTVANYQLGAFPLGFPLHGFFNDPRTYGVRVSAEF
jgi:iron complex outermembrane recepter protein